MQKILYKNRNTVDISFDFYNIYNYYNDSMRLKVQNIEWKIGAKIIDFIIFYGEICMLQKPQNCL